MHKDEFSDSCDNDNTSNRTDNHDNTSNNTDIQYTELGLATTKHEYIAEKQLDLTIQRTIQSNSQDMKTVKLERKKQLRHHAVAGIEKQAEKVNRGRLLSLEALSVGQIITVQVNCAAKHSQIYIMGEIINIQHRKIRGTDDETARYFIRTKYGKITKPLDRERLNLTSYTREILLTDDWPVKEITMEEAAKAAGPVQCRCSKNCATNSKCSCRLAGVLCTTRCHKGNGYNTYCQMINAEEFIVE